MNTTVLDEFKLNLRCFDCSGSTEHHVQKIEENGLVSYFAECDVCKAIEEYAENEIFPKRSRPRERTWQN